jgi:ribose-phosphate pyrophosphokinase
VRGEDMFIISRPRTRPGNLMELLIMVPAALLQRVTAVLPTSAMHGGPPPGHHHHRQTGREHARRHGNRWSAMDLHAAQIQGFFDIPVDNLYASPVLRSTSNTPSDQMDIID